MWILLRQKIPVEVAPPKMSIFWSVAWPMVRATTVKGKMSKKKFVSFREQRYDEVLKQVLEDEEAVSSVMYEEDLLKDTSLQDMVGFFAVGHTPNGHGARRICFCGTDVRVFPHEFSILPNNRMKFYIEKHQVYELLPDSIAGEKLLGDVLDGETRPLYEAALLDGCNHNQAILTALGHDVTLEVDNDYPPIGWYRMKAKYRPEFGKEWEFVSNVPEGATYSE